MSETTDAVVGVIASGYRESALGVWNPALEAVTNDVYPIVGDPSFVELEDDYADNADEIKALPGADEVYHRKSRGKLSRTLRLASEPATDFLALATGNIASSVASSAAAEVQTVTQTGVTAGAFKVRDTLDGQTSAEILWNDNAATRQTKLDAIFGAGNTTVLFSAEVMTITFGALYSATNYPTLEIIFTQAPVGGTFVLATTTEGAAAGQYTHTIKEPSICDLNPQSITWVEALRCNGIAAAFKIYPGTVVTGWGFEVGEELFVNQAIDLLTSGIELPGNLFSVPGSDAARTPLLNNQVEIWIGDSFTAPFKVGVDELASLSVKFNFGLVEPPRISNQKTVTEFQFPKGGMTIDLAAAFKGGKSSRFYEMIDACRDGYRPKLRVKFDPKSTPQRPFILDFNKLKVGGRVTPAGREQRTEMSLMALSNATDSGHFTVQTVTALASYLQVAV